MDYVGDGTAAKVPIPDRSVIAAAEQVRPVTAEGHGGRAAWMLKLLDDFPAAGFADGNQAGRIACRQ